MWILLNISWKTRKAAGVTTKLGRNNVNQNKIDELPPNSIAVFEDKNENPDL